MTVGVHGVFQRKAHRGFDSFRSRIGDRIAKNRHRQTGVIRLQWNKGAKRLHRQLHRDRRVLEGDFRNGVLAGEGAGFKPGKTGKIHMSEPARSIVGRRKPRLQDSRDRLPLSNSNPQRGKCVLRHLALVGPVIDLPVSQLAAAAEADAPGSDSTQRKRDRTQAASRIDSRVANGRFRGPLFGASFLLRRVLIAGGQPAGQRNIFQKCPPAYPVSLFHGYLYSFCPTTDFIRSVLARSGCLTVRGNRRHQPDLHRSELSITSPREQPDAQALLAGISPLGQTGTAISKYFDHAGFSSCVPAGAAESPRRRRTGSRGAGTALPGGCSAVSVSETGY